MTRAYLLSIVLTTLLHGQNIDVNLQRRIIFPDIAGYKTLKCDLHQHTVFSDGEVWPTIRVSEALKDNLDAIAVTEHLEYQPHKQDIPHPDRNRAFEIEKKSAAGKDLIIISGSEITRRMPPGHSNAIFITDANKLLVKDSIEVFRQAKEQGAFIFWNHPDWTGQKRDGIAELTDVHRKLIHEGLLNGIEVVNELTYSTEALQIALDNNLTIIGTSDIHGLIDWNHEIPQGGHRPVTLVFAAEKSENGIKDGLNNRRTVVFFNDLLIGRDAFLIPLIKASITVTDAKYQGENIILEVVLRNNSSCPLTLQNTSEFSFHDHSDLVVLKPLRNVRIKIKTRTRLQEVPLTFKVLNALNAPATHPDISLNIKVAN